jgi:hypothetical protein
MKRSVLLGSTAIVILAVAGLGLGLRSVAQRPDAAIGSGSTDPLGIEEFMRHPENHPGKVRVEGVVSTVAADAHLLTLIDRKEWEQCGEVNCAPLSLPVRWNGAMPEIEDGVEVGGRVSQEAGKLVFVAETLTPVPLERPQGQ